MGRMGSGVRVSASFITFSAGFSPAASKRRRLWGFVRGGRLTSYRPNHNSTGPGPFCAQFTSVRYALVAASGVKEAITGFDRVW